MLDVIVLIALALILALVLYGKHARRAALLVAEKRRLDRACALLQEEFVVLHLETTGFHATRHAIIEIGAIRVTPAVVADKEKAEIFQALVKTRKNVPAKVTDITGLTREILDRDGDELRDALARLLEFVDRRRIVSYNAESDMAFLHAAFESVRLPPLRNKVSSALEMSRLAFPQLKDHTLATVARTLGKEQQHRAIGDAYVALTVYVAAVGRLGRI